MVVKPRVRGFICTTAHPRGCAEHVRRQIEYVRAQPAVDASLNNVLVVGCSGGYGLASRIVAAFGCGAKTLGISFEKAPTEKKTATYGWYNNRAFEAAADQAGTYARTLDGDAYSDEMKAQAVAALRENFGKVDLLVYSLASPVRAHPRTGELHRSAIKPLGEAVRSKSLNVGTGEVHEVALEPATPEEQAATVQVMGGEDWEFWVNALREADLLADGFRTVAYTYVGSELTWPIYWHATLGKAKEDVDRAAASINRVTADVNGRAQVAALKAVVTQASTAIPVVPLYASLLFRVMKDQGVHENVIEHIHRLFATQLATGVTQRLDDEGRIRVDDVELSAPIQNEMRSRWADVTTENLNQLGDLDGFMTDFMRIFGFEFDNVDYDADVPLDEVGPLAIG